MRRLAFACFGVALALVAGCASRTDITLLDPDLLPLDGGDASADGIVIVEGGTDSSVVDPGDALTDAGPDRFIDIFDVLPIPEGGPIGDCAGCVRDNCGKQVNECINKPACRNGLGCVMTRCLAGGGGGGGGPGGFDFACVNDCFKGDFGSAGLAISAFTCITGKCGSKCGSLLGGIPGFPGGGGSGGGSGSGGSSGGSGFEAELPESFGPEDLAKLDPSYRFCFSPEAFAPWREELARAACEQGIATCAP